MGARNVRRAAQGQGPARTLPLSPPLATGSCVVTHSVCSSCVYLAGAARRWAACGALESATAAQAAQAQAQARRASRGDRHNGGRRRPSQASATPALVAQLVDRAELQPAPQQRVDAASASMPQAAGDSLAGPGGPARGRARCGGTRYAMASPAARGCEQSRALNPTHCALDTSPLQLARDGNAAVVVAAACRAGDPLAPAR